MNLVHLVCEDGKGTSVILIFSQLKLGTYKIRSGYHFYLRLQVQMELLVIMPPAKSMRIFRIRNTQEAEHLTNPDILLLLLLLLLLLSLLSLVLTLT